MEELKKTEVKYPYLEKPVEIYERQCGHKIIFAYKKGSLINISSWVKTGSINENDGNNGISHFLEHLMFKGTSKHKAGEFDRTLESKGAIVNAATWKDYTFYYVTIPKGSDNRNFKDTLELHADMMLDPVIPDNEIGEPFDINNPNIKTKRERHVVIEEIRMRKDQPWTKVYNQVNANMYSNHPYKRDVIGNEQIISTVTRQTVLDYYKTHYTPNNITTVIVGDMKAEDVIPAVIKEFDFKGRQKRANEKYPHDLPVKKTKEVQSYSKINTGFLMFGYLAAPAADIKTSAILEMIALILGQGQSSRLYQELVEKPKKPVFNIISTDFYQFRDGGNFFIQANFKPDFKNEAISLIKNQTEKLINEGVTEKELKKAKKKLKACFAENSETVSDIAETIGFYMTVCDKLECVEEYIEAIENITLEDVKSTAKKYLGINNAVISVLMPETYQK
ncbi:MAG: insulinase family protein [Candidatus Gastranaerophilales bacterium]|nr:insulinase family protein [Candidatus Gastranaerophilales bacterium]